MRLPVLIFLVPEVGTNPRKQRKQRAYKKRCKSVVYKIYNFFCFQKKDNILSKVAYWLLIG